jgi:hypothetical protein
MIVTQSTRDVKNGERRDRVDLASQPPAPVLQGHAAKVKWDSGRASTLRRTHFFWSERVSAKTSMIIAQ